MNIRFTNLAVAVFALFTILTAHAEDGEKAILFTQANIWYEKPTKIPSTNYHVGGILPVGTKVTLDRVEDDEIRFSDANGSNYRIVVVIKHNNVPGPALSERLFGPQDPMAEGGKFSSFTKEEQEQIRFGTIAKGMRKDAVIMAYGYPPTIRTPTIESPSWTYWKNRWVTRIVRFDADGIVMDIQG